MGAPMNRKKIIFVSVALLATLFIQPMALSQAAGTQHTGHSQLKSFYPTAGTITSTASSVAGGLGSVTYQPGGTIISIPNIYVIWYGNWDSNSCSAKSGTSSTPSIINDFLGSLGESDWNKINTTYYQHITGRKIFVQPTAEVAGCTVDAGSQGLSLDTLPGPQVSDVVDHALSSKMLKTDPNGVYLVLTASNVDVTDFMTLMCAYHYFYDNSQSTIKYAFIGDASANLHSCAPQTTISPNGNPAADAMVSVIAHEFVEAVSDPTGTSWFDQAGFENADKCAWNYGKAFKATNGSFANMALDNRQYLIQQNVAANTNTCVLSLKGNESDHQSGTNN
jgi:hypothetical protein